MPPRTRCCRRHARHAGVVTKYRGRVPHDDDPRSHQAHADLRVRLHGVRITFRRALSGATSRCVPRPDERREAVLPFAVHGVTRRRRSAAEAAAVGAAAPCGCGHRCRTRKAKSAQLAARAADHRARGARGASGGRLLSRRRDGARTVGELRVPRREERQGLLERRIRSPRLQHAT
jgi:hypothetical protein